MNFLGKIRFFIIERKPRLTIFGLLVLFLVYFYSPILFHPANYIFGDKGDSIKNYFCYDWHVQNDKAFVNYTGTNYPFGEQHAFTDGNPLLSNLIKTLPFLKSQSIAVFNLSLVLSIIVTALLLFSILKEFKVANGFAIIAAIGIAILNPQTNRLGGHFNLAYSFFIPLVIYLLILFETREEKAKYNTLIGFVLLCSFFVHPYMGMILASMVFLYHAFKIIVFYKKIKRQIFPFLIQAIFPVLLYFLYLKITDTHTNRTSHPYGFLFFTARIETIFVSSLPPLRHMLSQVIKVYEQNWEGLAYVGLTSMFAILYLPFLTYNKRKELKFFMKENKNIVSLLILSLASVFLLIFSMGYPFKCGGGWILDAVPLIKQFRSPGRFAWVFYYVATIASTIILSNYFLIKINRYVRTVLVAAMLLLFTVEGLPFHKQFVEIGFVKNCFNANNLDEEMKQICAAINKVKPQAIIPLPFFHTGTDYFSFNGTDKIKVAAFVAALNTNTPILGSCTDRTSLDEAKISVQVFGSSLINKDIINFIKPNQAFCVLYSKELLTENEQQILARGKIILETSSYLLTEIYPFELVKNDIERQKKYFNENRNTMQLFEGIYMKYPLAGEAGSSFVKSITFDSLPGKQFTGKIDEEVFLFKIPANTVENDQLYEISFWLDLKGEDELTNSVIVSEVSNKENSIKVLAEKKCGQMPNVVKDKVLVVIDFKSLDKENEIRISLKGNPEYKGNFTLNNLLIRRKDVDVYKMNYSSALKDSVLRVNNFELR